MKKRIVYPVLVMLFTLCFSVSVIAQDDGSEGTGDPLALPNDGVSDVPIDGGLSVLLAAGVGYGIKKVRDSRKEQREKDSLLK